MYVNYLLCEYKISRFRCLEVKWGIKEYKEHMPLYTNLEWVDLKHWKFTGGYLQTLLIDLNVIYYSLWKACLGTGELMVKRWLIQNEENKKVFFCIIIINFLSPLKSALPDCKYSYYRKYLLTIVWNSAYLGKLLL